MAVFSEHMPFSDYLSRLPVESSELVQLDKGRLAFSSIDVRGTDSFIVRFRTQARSIFSVVPEHDWWGILIPLSWSGDYLLNGHEATPSTVFLLDGKYEYHVVAERRDAITVGIRRSVLEGVLANLSGQEYCRLTHNHRRLEIPDSQIQQLTSILFKIIAVAAPCRSRNDFFRMPRILETDMISAIADWMIEKEVIKTQDLCDRRSDLSVCREALRTIVHNQSVNVSMAELCQAAGVGKSRLHEAFINIHGVSPGHYIYRRRLTIAHNTLLDGDGSNSSVKNAAILCGFLDSGRFARAYSDMFGELPRETLARQTG